MFVGLVEHSPGSAPYHLLIIRHTDTNKGRIAGPEREEKIQRLPTENAAFAAGEEEYTLCGRRYRFQPAALCPFGEATTSMAEPGELRLHRPTRQIRWRRVATSDVSRITRQGDVRSVLSHVADVAYGDPGAVR